MAESAGEYRAAGPFGVRRYFCFGTDSLLQEEKARSFFTYRAYGVVPVWGEFHFQFPAGDEYALFIPDTWVVREQVP